ncbi:hypothetical protein Ngar_c12010 [Candidatus Nitrososphaera gargensis Ga9.2]|uniref:Multi-ubiquitin domain-containing protein n=1 Tax=Nitrososphaera gargensis (strain Ga9.2) TaxID=1237085 RepID=K0I9Y8_NITGG|nr:hypothetical protein Ngar_c12010 [Candidatus Nitrososphaera gargensis Ga9.2]
MQQLLCLWLSNIKSDELIIFIDGKKIRAPKKILTGEQSLEIANLPPDDHNVYVILEKNKSHQVDIRESIEVQNGMNFVTTRRTCFVIHILIFFSVRILQC